MQVTKLFSGTCTVGSSTTRTASWGGTATATVYDARNDFYNQTIADFLANDCGVEGVVYEARGDYSEKYVWIYDVPFYFGPTTSAYYNRMFGPFGSTYLASTGSSSASYCPFSGAATGDYNFYLYFTGSAEAGFCLRVSDYNGTVPLTGTTYRFTRCTNLCNGRDALVVVVSGHTASSTAGMLGSYFAVEIENGLPVNDSALTLADSDYFPIAITVSEYQTGYMDNKLPLIPVHYGIYQANKCYMHVRGINLPAATANTVDAQTEITVGNRTFIVTTAETVATGYINMGLIDVT